MYSSSEEEKSSVCVESLGVSVRNHSCNPQPCLLRFLSSGMTDKYFHAQHFLLFAIFECLEKLKLVIHEDTKFQLD